MQYYKTAIRTTPHLGGAIAPIGRLAHGAPPPMRHASGWKSKARSRNAPAEKSCRFLTLRDELHATAAVPGAQPDFWRHFIGVDERFQLYRCDPPTSIRHGGPSVVITTSGLAILLPAG
jgi:hypothetical protein